MGYYLAIKDKIISFSWKWMKLETIILNEINHIQKVKYCIFSLTLKNLKDRKKHESRSDTVEKRKKIRAQGGGWEWGGND